MEEKKSCGRYKWEKLTGEDLLKDKSKIDILNLRDAIYKVHDEHLDSAREFDPRLGVQSFDSQILYDAENDIVLKLRNEIEDYKKKFQEDAEISIICQMALQYVYMMRPDIFGEPKVKPRKEK